MNHDNYRPRAYGRRPDLAELDRVARMEMQARNAGAETAAPDAMIERLMKLIGEKFYAAAPVQKWMQEQKELMLAITWPATWLNERAIGLPVERYERILREIIAGIVEHGDLTAVKYVPAYLGNCIKKWFIHKGESLYEERKHIRNAIDLRFLSACAGKPATTPDPMAALSAAHRVLLVAKHYPKAKPAGDARQGSLFDQ